MGLDYVEKCSYFLCIVLFVNFVFTSGSILGEGFVLLVHLVNYSIYSGGFFFPSVPSLQTFPF